MAKKRRRLSARKWADTPDQEFQNTVVNVPEGVSLFRPRKAGIYKIEIIPYVVPEVGEAGPNPHADPGELHYERTFFVHHGVGVDSKSYVCLARTANKRCPICEHRRQLMRSREADDDLIRALAPKQRQLWNVFDHGEPDVGVQVWDVSYHLFGKQLKREIRDSEEEDGFEYFADPEEGMTLRVGMDEVSLGGRTFLSTATINFRPRRKPVPERILQAAQPLDSLLVVYPYDKLKSLYLQEEDGEGVDESDADEEIIEEAEPEEIAFSRGDEVVYNGEKCSVVKVNKDKRAVTLMGEDDLYRDVPVSDLGGSEPVADEDSEDEIPLLKKPNGNGQKPKVGNERDATVDDWDDW